MVDLVKAPFRVLLTFDVDAESAQVRKSPQLPVTLSKGRFARVGVERILEMLGRHKIRSTFFVPSWTAEAYPELVRDIVRRGHEVAAHGHLHENLSELDEAAEREVHEKSVRILTRIAGRRPVGFRAPYWEWSTRTPGFLREYGFAYDSSLMDDDRAYRVRDGPAEGLYELPVEWFLDDWTLFEEQRLPPGAVLETWKSEFDAAYRLGLGYFLLTMHPECIGRASRMRMLEQLVEHVETKRGIAFARCDELVDRLQKSGTSAD